VDTGEILEGDIFITKQKEREVIYYEFIKLNQAIIVILFALIFLNEY